MYKQNYIEFFHINMYLWDTKKISHVIRSEGLTLPDSMIQRLWGLPFSTSVTLSFLMARLSTYTVVGSGQDAPCRVKKHNHLQL